MNRKVLVAVVGGAERLMTHGAKKPPIKFDDLIPNFVRWWNPSGDEQGQRIACKFQVALVPIQELATFSIK